MKHRREGQVPTEDGVVEDAHRQVGRHNRYYNAVDFVGDILAEGTGRCIVGVFRLGWWLVVGVAKLVIGILSDD